MGATIKIFNFGTHSARDYWNLITCPDLEDFRKTLSPRTSAHVAQSLWNLWEWLCVESGKDPKKPDFDELKWIQEIAFAAKHRELTRACDTTHMGFQPSGVLAYGVAGGYGVPSGGYASSYPVIVLKDGTSRGFAEIVERVAENLSGRL